MPGDLITALIGLGGVVLGTGTTATINIVNQRSQSKQALAAEERAHVRTLEEGRRERAMMATARAADALSRLLALEGFPKREPPMTVEAIEQELERGDPHDRAR